MDFSPHPRVIDRILAGLHQLTMTKWGRSFPMDEQAVERTIAEAVAILGPVKAVAVFRETAVVAINQAPSFPDITYGITETIRRGGLEHHRLASQAPAAPTAPPAFASAYQRHDGAWIVKRGGEQLAGPFPNSAAAYRWIDRHDPVAVHDEERRLRISIAFADRDTPQSA
ncbi:MAG: hypothetical protein O9296_01825 [Novosphingobium sp.]|nr:hypothetical protein [Novosphingobium sp.]